MSHRFPVRIVSILWSSHVQAFALAAEETPYVDLIAFSHKEIQNNPELLERFWIEASKADAVFLYWTTDGFWDEVQTRMADLSDSTVVVTTSSDPLNWGRSSTVDLSVCARAYDYMAEGGRENYRRLLNFIARQVDPKIPVQEPLFLPWQGIADLRTGDVYDSVEDYLEANPPKYEHTVGLLFSRSYFVNDDTAVERELAEALEREGINVLPVFTHGVSDDGAGALGPVETARKFFIGQNGRSRVKALVNLMFFLLDRDGPAAEAPDSDDLASRSVELFRKLNVPVFKPVISYGKNLKEWEEDPQGLISEVAFGIAMPEFEGNIEPIVLACSSKTVEPKSGTECEIREAIGERVHHIAERIARWVRLLSKPPEERKVVFVLHKNECAGLEATVGSAAGLDSGESIIRIMKKMKDAGYRIENIPSSGEELMQMILERKAISEFRWTTVDEIVAKGGYLVLLDAELYREWFSELPSKARDELTKVWGEPPGQEVNGVPPSMVWNGKLVITGLSFGNVSVMVQPKRGCAGSRCDGRVCKILHDPDLPPPHQYIATYMYMDRVFGADVIIHVGTHGNLEWLPGKGVGLSSACWPDVAIGHLPHLYIYNSDNPAEGIVAKRRGYAVLVDYMQAVMDTAGLYGELAELEDLLNQYTRASSSDRARAHQLEHLIRDAVKRCRLEREVGLGDCADFEEVVERCHEIISRIKNSQNRRGMHIFGQLPEGNKRSAFINTIVRFDSESELNSRRLVFELWGEDIAEALKHPGKIGKSGRTYAEMLFEADEMAKGLIEEFIKGKDAAELLGRELNGREKLRERFNRFAELVRHIDDRIRSSLEIESLLNAVGGGYVPPGPSGYISRGRYDVLPTGRNFYNVDPSKIPTTAAWRVGVRLAESLLERFRKEEGRYPECVGMVWLASDIMRADGEQIGQILHLLGLRPKWDPAGRISGFDVVPLEELGRPRIDLNIRVSGITRDCFPEAVAYVDKAVRTVALLDEPPEKNFVRKHVLDQALEEGISLDDESGVRRLTYRIFCAQPGVYRSGVNLAVYASAWKSEKDLSDVYIFWNGYAYGDAPDGASYGVKAHKELVKSLKRVEVTFDKHVSDESDFLSCCGYFGNYGGMTVAVKAISGRTPRTYYGDTRDPAAVSVVDFADEMRRVVQAKLLHPEYIKGMKAHGYKGAGDISKRIGRVYGFGATTGKVESWIFDEIAKTFVLDREARKWFERVNPWALEEIARRLLEAKSRGIWKPDPEILKGLKEAYLEVEGSLEDTVDEVEGDFQGGAVDVVTADEIESWKQAMRDLFEEIEYEGKET